MAFSMAEAESQAVANKIGDWARESGKQHFRDGDYIEAMNKFNCSLASAGKESADMGFAYGNRSACFFELKMFNECLRDIELAKKSNYPRNQLKKLNECAAKCRQFLNDEEYMSKSPSVREPTLSFNEHAKFTGVADCLKLEENDDHGRHVIAACDLKIGQTILIEKPFAIIPKGGRLRCMNCFKAFTNVIPCENCDAASFCDADCLDKSLHEYDCNRPACLSRKETFDLVLNMFFKINEAIPNVDGLMEMVDMLLKRQDPSGFTDANQKAFGWIFQLVHNHGKQTKEHLRRLRGATAIAIAALNRNPISKRKFSALKHRRFLQHLLLHLFHVAEHGIDLLQYQQTDNSEMAMKSSLGEYATGMYPFACYFNHSCIPNICIYSVDDRLIGKVIRPIKKGQQLFRSYIPGVFSFSTSESLKKQLENRYFFKCECLVCSGMWEPLVKEVDLSDDPVYDDGMKPAMMRANEIRKLSNDDIAKHEKKAFEFLEKYDRFHPVNDTICMQDSLRCMWNVLAMRI